MNMKSVVLWFLIASFYLGSAAAQNLDASRERPVKDTPIKTYIAPAEPRQGGDTVFDATVIPDLPYTVSGNTIGYIDDYDEVCPYTGSTAPDVVYSYTPTYTMSISVDLCGSGYDTKTYVYDADLNMVACNDDYYTDGYCGIYVSKIEFVDVIAGETYYIVIDGYGGDAGPYELMVIDSWHCCFECPPDAVEEGEPELSDGYVDAYNGGCNSPEYGSPFQAINWTNDDDGYPPFNGSAWLCGKSGWFQSPGGADNRDTDWFRVYARETGEMEITIQSEYDCYLYKLSGDCDNLVIDEEVFSWCYYPNTMTFPVEAGEEIWLWFGPTEFTGWVFEFNYIMTVSNNMYDVVPIEEKSWGQVKSLYR